MTPSTSNDRRSRYRRYAASIGGLLAALAALAAIGTFMNDAKIWPFNDPAASASTSPSVSPPSVAPSGSAAHTIVPTGSPSIDPSPTIPPTDKPTPTPALKTQITVVDNGQNAGFYSAIARGADGLGLIAYRADGRLKVRHCQDAACTQSTQTIVDSDLDVGGRVGGTSIAIGSDDVGIVAYHDVADGDLNVAYCVDQACSEATITTLDSVGDVGASPSVAIGPDGLALIAYRTDTDADLRVAYCRNTSCSEATISTIDAKSQVVWGPKLTIAGGLGVVAYLERLSSGTLQLKVARCRDTACTTADGNVPGAVPARGFETSIAVGSDGKPLIVYSGDDANDLHVFHCSAVTCADGTDTRIDGNAGLRNSLIIGADERGLIVYYDGADRHLRAAHCDNRACTKFETHLIDGDGNVGDTNAVTLGSGDLPLISYFERESGTDGNLRVARCGDSACGANN